MTSMTEPTFVIGAAIACGTVLAIVKTIAAATVGRSASADMKRLLDQSEQYGAIIEETQATLAHQAAQLAELQERVDFAERMLAQSRVQPSIGPGDAGR
jgi:hypothetical protein